MGTSSIFNGPKDNSSNLLPFDYQSNSDADDASFPDNVLPNIPGTDVNVPSSDFYSWKKVKSEISRLASNYNSLDYKSKQEKIRKVASHHIKASGGSAKITQSALSGIATGGSLFGFFSNIATKGYADTFSSLNISTQGKTAKEVFSQLVNAISKISNTKEDIISREATTAALSELYDYLDRNDMDFEALNEMPLELINLCEITYITEWIWGKLFSDLGSRVDNKASDDETAANIEQDFKEYIRSTVEIQFNKSGSRSNPRDFAASLFTQCYEAMELYIYEIEL